MNSNSTQVPNKDDVLVRAYHLKKANHGTSDLERYYMAEKIQQKILETESYETNTKESPYCRFCYKTYGTVRCQFLPAEVGVCVHCFMKYSKEELISRYSEDHNTSVAYVYT
jgi:hypothetical protein